MADPKKNEEIDLLNLFLKAITIVRKNFWLFVVFFLLGTALGAAHFYTTKKIYESRLIVSSSILTNAYAKVLFENATKHIEQGDNSVLQQQFHISEHAAAQLVSLKIENLNKPEAITPEDNERFAITAEVFDQEILPELQKGLIGYLENNEFAKVRVEQKRTFFKEMVASVDKEIRELEALKARISNGEFFQSAKGNIMFDPTTVNSKIIELNEKKIGYENNLQVVNGAQVIESFAKFQKQTKPKLSASMISGALLGVLMAAIVIAIRAIQKLLAAADVA